MQHSQGLEGLKANLVTSFVDFMVEQGGKGGLTHTSTKQKHLKHGQKAQIWSSALEPVREKRVFFVANCRSLPGRTPKKSSETQQW